MIWAQPWLNQPRLHILCTTNHSICIETSNLMRKPVAKAIAQDAARSCRAEHVEPPPLDNVHKTPVVRIPRHHRGNQEIWNEQGKTWSKPGHAQKKAQLWNRNNLSFKYQNLHIEWRSFKSSKSDRYRNGGRQLPSVNLVYNNNYPASIRRIRKH